MCRRRTYWYLVDRVRGKTADRVGDSVRLSVALVATVSILGVPDRPVPDGEYLRCGNCLEDYILMNVIMEMGRVRIVRRR